MRVFEVTFTDGRVERIEAAEFWSNDWSINFAYMDERPSKAFSAKPGDVVVTRHTFRMIAGREVKEVREIPG